MNYLIVDLDDTLLTTDKLVSEYTLTGIKKLREMGFLFVINTARSFEASYELIEMLKPDYSILNGGASIFDINNKLIYSRLVSKEDTNYIINEIINDKEVMKFSIQLNDKLLTEDYTYQSKTFKPIYFNFRNNVLNEPAAKIIISATNSSKWERLAKTMGYEYELYFDGLWFRISNSNKYKGNLALFEFLNDNNPKDYVFGDDHGDIEMINNAYHGVLLSNSKLKDKCKNITKYDNNNDGIIKHMEEILKL